jgi:flagellum-specific peptidoglycan hydrolase FlgJ
MLRFFKNNWFLIGLLFLALAAFVRKNAKTSLFTRAPKMEKYTEAPPVAEASPSQSGLFSGQSGGVAVPDIDPTVGQAFIRRFSSVAQGEQKKFGIPASALLACAYLNSFAGQRNVAAQANNFFVLPCSPDWSGQTIAVNDRCYRRYKTAWDSFRGFNQYLSQRDWYEAARSKAGKDSHAWLKLFAAHRLTDIANFEAAARQTLEFYQLTDLDGGQ